MKLRYLLGAMTMLACLSGCSLFTSQSWQEKHEYRYQPPTTGSNVGRWIPVSDGSESKPKPKKKKSQVKKHEEPQSRDTAPAPPADRFR